MTRPQLEVAEVIRAHGGAFLDQHGAALSPGQRRVLSDLARCRTAALGGHVTACDRCGRRQVAYNSCRDRHCPKGQAGAAARWAEAQATDLLPVEYFHVVFTLPAALRPIALQNQSLLYGLLFRAAAETLLQVAADPRHLGAEIGFVAVLHTWGQAMQHHPHVHGIVPGGGLSADGSRWIACRPGFFLPVRVLSRVFRGKFLARLGAAFDRGRLAFRGRLGELAEAPRFHRLLVEAARTEWVVYARPPFGGPGRALKYLARYTHRVAISNRRLVALEGGRVRFRCKDSARVGRRRTTTLTATEFLRRFLLHVLPSGFVRIRHYGFHANRHRREKVARCRELLGVAAGGPEPPRRSAGVGGIDPATSAAMCPSCGVGRLVLIEVFPPASKARDHVGRSGVCPAFDTS